MITREDLKVGMIVEVKGRWDRQPYDVEIIELGPGLSFSHRHRWIISSHMYKDIIRIKDDIDSDKKIKV